MKRRRIDDAVPIMGVKILIDRYDLYSIYSHQVFFLNIQIGSFVDFQFKIVLPAK